MKGDTRRVYYLSLFVAKGVLVEIAWLSFVADGTILFQMNSVNVYNFIEDF